MLTTTSIANHEERRSEPRRSCRIPVRVHVRGPDWTDSFVLYSADLSEKGMFLRSDWLYPRGEWLDLEIPLHGQSHPIRGEGCVTRVNAGQRDQASGMVINLDRFREDDRQVLRSLLD